MTQPDRKLQEKWEKRLKKRGLGLVQPMTDNSEGEMLVSMSGTTDDMLALRKKVDSGDRFMDAHQVTKVRSIERMIPEWAMNDKEVQRLLLLAFPKLKTRLRQRKRAGIYVRIIHLYWRMRLPYPVVAKELGISEVSLKRKIQILTRHGEGLNAHGHPRKRVTPPTPLEGSPETTNGSIKSPPLLRTGNGGNGEDGTPQTQVPMPKDG